MILAQMEMTTGNNRLAIEHLELARSSHPQDLAPRLLLASIFVNDNDLLSAEIVAREMAAIGSNQPAVNNVIGDILIEAGAIEEALMAYQIAAQTAPEYLPALLGLSRSHLALGNSAEARRVLTQALELDPNNQIAVPALALVELSSGALDDARARLERHLMRYPDDPNGLSILGDVFLALDENIEAALVYARATQVSGNSTFVSKEHRARLASKSDPAGPLLRWLADHPDDVNIRSQLAEYYQSIGRNADAVTEFERVASDGDNDPVLLNNLAWAYLEQGDLNTALAFGQRALAARPDSPEIADTLGWIHFRLGNLDESENILRSAVAASRDNHEISYHLAAVLARNGKHEEARRLLQQLGAAQSDFPSRNEAEQLLEELTE